MRIARGILAITLVVAASPLLAQATGTMNGAPAGQPAGAGGPPGGPGGGPGGPGGAPGGPGGGPNLMAGPKVVYPATPMPKPTGNFIGLSTANGKIAWKFVDLWFNQKKPELAFDTYVARSGYMNHSFISRNAQQSFETQRTSESRITPPGAQFIFRQVIAQGDLVVLHIEAHAAANTVGDEMVMFLRIRNGKIVDHWDMHQELTADSNVFQNLDR